MATLYRTNNAPAVAQISTITFSSIANANTYAIVINGKSVSYAATSSTAADTYAALMNSWNSSPEPEHQELIASGGVTNVVLTARSAGVPSSVTATATTGTATVTATRVASGPNFWSGAANWTGTPTTGDTLIVENSSIPILYGLTDTNDYAKVIIRSTQTGAIGLPPTNSRGYTEYRTRRLTLGTGANPIQIEIGEGDGQQAERILIDVLTAATTLIVYGTSRGANSYPVELWNVGGTSTVALYGGNVKLDNAASATLASVDAVSSGSSRANLHLGSNLTVTLANLYNVQATILGTTTTLNAFDSSVVTTQGSGTITTATLGTRGSLDHRSSGTITNLFVAADGVFDLSKGVGAVTITNATIYSRGAINDKLGRAVWTNGIELSGCRLAEVSLDLGYGKTIEV